MKSIEETSISLSYRVSGNASTEKKIKYLGHFLTKSNNSLSK